MTYRWEPTTPLDRILETGFKRMDEAVEGVIDKYPPVFFESEVLRLELENTKRLLDRFHNPVYPCRYHDASALQGEYNRQMSMMVERAAMAPQPSWDSYAAARAQGSGLHSIGDQSAFGSPLYQLGAAYRNAFGGGL